MPRPRPDETLDSLLRERIRLLQSRKGYRTSVDAMALAWFATQHAPPTSPLDVLDLGAGSGLVAILVGRHRPDARLWLVERQPLLAERAARNVLLNSLADRAHVVLHDIAATLPEVPQVDLVVCNPPYYQPPGRMLPRDPERRDAHYESTADLHRFAEVARAVLKPHGQSFWVYPAAGRDRLVDALLAARFASVEVVPLRHRFGDPQPIRVLVRTGWEGAQDVRTLPSVSLHEADALDETYHPAIETFLRSL